MDYKSPEFSRPITLIDTISDMCEILDKGIDYSLAYYRVEIEHWIRVSTTGGETPRETPQKLPP